MRVLSNSLPAGKRKSYSIEVPNCLTFKPVQHEYRLIESYTKMFSIILFKHCEDIESLIPYICNAIPDFFGYDFLIFLAG